MKGISSQQGYICVSEIERSACHKVIWFTVWNVFFANVLSASAFSLLSIFLELKEIPSKLAVSVPAQVKQIPIFKYSYKFFFRKAHIILLSAIIDGT